MDGDSGRAVFPASQAGSSSKACVDRCTVANPARPLHRTGSRAHDNCTRTSPRRSLVNAYPTRSAPVIVSRLSWRTDVSHRTEPKRRSAWPTDGPRPHDTRAVLERVWMNALDFYGPDIHWIGAQEARAGLRRRCEGHDSARHALSSTCLGIPAGTCSCAPAAVLRPPHAGAVMQRVRRKKGASCPRADSGREVRADPTHG